YQRNRELLDLVTSCAIDWSARRAGLRDGWLLACFKISSETSVVGFSPNGQYALSGSNDNRVRLWNLVTGREMQRFQGHTSIVTAVCYSPDGTYGLSGSADKTVRLWDLKSGREVQSFAGHTAEILSVCISSDARYAVSSGGDGTVRVWCLETGRQ